MTTVERLLQHKGHTVWSIPPDASVFEAVQLMADKRVGALMVVDRNELIGVISERDYAREIVLKDRVSRDTPVSAIMTRRVLYSPPPQNPWEGLGVVTPQKLRPLPVVGESRPGRGILLLDWGENPV